MAIGPFRYFVLFSYLPFRHFFPFFQGTPCELRGTLSEVTPDSHKAALLETMLAVGNSEKQQLSLSEMNELIIDYMHEVCAIYGTSWMKLVSSTTLLL